MKVLNSILAFFFLLFAIVQYNDPDPWLWIILYLFIAVISAFAAAEIYPKVWIRAGIVACIIGLGVLLPDFINWIQNGAESIVQKMKAEKPHIELTREFLGLFLSILVLGFHLWAAPKGSNK